MTDFIWTDDSVAQLRALFADPAKWSASQIAKKLGNGLSRNAIIGKAHRLGLDRRKVGRKPNQSAAAAPIIKPRRVPKHEAKGAPTGSLAYKVIHGIKRKLAAAPVDPTPFVCRDADVESFLALSIDQLTEETCRWPSESPPFTYCGREPVAGTPYCLGHCRIAYQPPPQRKPTTPTSLGQSRGGVFGRVA